MPHKKIVRTALFENEIDFRLIAIHSVAEDYFLAYKINQQLNTLLYNVTEYATSSTNPIFFSRFIWDNESEDCPWELISNQWSTNDSKTVSSPTLFGVETKQRKQLIDELPQVDYLLKLSLYAEDQSLLSKLNKMNEVQFVYEITDNKIKLNPNLIFE